MGRKDDDHDIVFFKKGDGGLMFACTMRIHNKKSLLVWFTNLSAHFVDMWNEIFFNPIMPNFIVCKPILLSSKAKKVLYLRGEVWEVFEGKDKKGTDKATRSRNA